MKENNRALTFFVSLTVPAVATVYQVRDYIRTAVEQWGGGYEKSDLLFSGRIKHVKVKREGDSGKRYPMEAEPIDLTALIRWLQMVESQARVTGKIPNHMPVKIPVKVSEGFGVFRYSIVHITAKPGKLVLLHFTRED